MSRILKRPMFRRGGSTNTGIMSGLVDRTKHAENPFPGSNIDREALMGNRELLESILEQSTPKTRLPTGEFGLNLASGMTLTDALRDPYKRFTRADDAREAAIKGGAAKLAIGQALKPGKGKFVTLPPELAKARFKGAYSPNTIYQVNTVTGEVKTDTVGPKEVIRDTGDAYKKEIDKSAGESDVKTINEAEKSYLQANKFDQTIDVLTVLANKSNEELKTGALGPLRLSATKLLADLGVDVNLQNVPLAELLNAVGGKVAIDALQGFKGAISNKELDFVISINPGLATSKQGIKLQLQLLSRANDISKRYYTEIVAPFVDKNGGLRGTLNGKSFKQLQMDFYDKNPYLTPEIENKIAAAQTIIDPEYAKNIVIKDGVRYFVVPSTGEVRRLPDVED